MKGKKVSLVIETAFGVDNAAPKPYPICVNSVGLTSSDEFEANECIDGKGADSGGDEQLIGSSQSGDIVINATYENAYFPLAMQYGMPVTVDNGDGTFTHTFSSSTECIPSYSIQTILTDSGDDCAAAVETEWVERYNGVKSNTFGLTVSKTAPKFTLGLMGGRFRASYKKSYNTDGVLEATLTKVDEANEVTLTKTPLIAKTASISLDGASYCRLSEFAISSDNGIKETDVICEIGTNLEKEKYDTTIAIKGIFDKDLIPKIADNETVAIGLKYASGTNSLEFIFAECKGKFQSKAISYNEKVMLDETLTAARINGTERCKVVLTNTVAAYN